MERNPFIARETNTPGRQVCYQLQAYPVLTSTRTPNAYSMTDDQLDELTSMISTMTIADDDNAEHQSSSSEALITPLSLDEELHCTRNSLGRYKSRVTCHKTGETKAVKRSARLARK